MRNRLIATMTICSLAAGVATAPTAFAAPVFGAEIVKRDGTNMCVFGDGEDSDSATGILTVGKQYRKLRDRLRTDIRKTLPQLKDEFAAADRITGTGDVPARGTVDSPELAAIITAVTKAMVEHGYREQEVYLAFHHTPDSEKIRATIKPENLVVLGDMDIYSVRALLAARSDREDSIPQRVDRFFASAAQVRDWARQLQRDSSIALLGTVNATETNELLESTKNITRLLPSALKNIVRGSLTQCQTMLNSRNTLDGTVSSELSSNPTKGTSSDPEVKKQKEDTGNLFTGSAELSSGKNLSTAEQYKELSSGDSSDDKERSRKIGVLLAMIGLVSFVINMLIKASPLAAMGQKMINDLLNQAKADAGEKAADGQPAEG